jgi:hypothetical protein
MIRAARRPPYGSFAPAAGKGSACGAPSCVVVVALLALLGAAVGVNYVTLERRRCAVKLDELEEDLEQREAVIDRLKRQLADARQGPAPAGAAAAAAAAAAVAPPAVAADAWGDESAEPAVPPPPPLPQSHGRGSAPQRLRPRQPPPPGGRAAAAAPAAPAAPAKPPAAPQVDGRGVAIEPAPASAADARALLVICFNRPEYLARTLGAVLDRLPAYNRPHVYVSQDGDHAGVSAVVADFAARFAARAPDVPFTHWRHPAVAPEALARAASWAVGYYKLAQHFGWALGRVFGSELRHPRVLILEDDLEVAVDFFDYFTAMEPLLDGDPSLLAVSAWSDLGQPQFVADPRAVHRSDFFPGLGWMINAHVSRRAPPPPS